MLVTSSHSKKIFEFVVKRFYWLQFDFWLACLAGVIFWLTYKLYYIDADLTLSFPELTFTLFSLIFIFPILEEIVFRGLIQESIQKLFQHYQIKTTFLWRISFANIFASLFFSLTHIGTHPALWALATLIPSLIFGYFKDKYQSLYPSIALHIFYNFGFYMLL